MSTINRPGFKAGAITYRLDADSPAPQRPALEAFIASLQGKAGPLVIGRLPDPAEATGRK